MPSFLQFARDQYATLPVPQAPADVSNATYIVTGANSGLGFECAKHLVRMGVGRLILTVRSKAKGEAALAAIRSQTGREDAGEVWELDLASLDSIESFAQRIITLDRLDGLIANAGVVMGTFEVIEGTEASLQVNVVSTMLLAFRALPKLQESARRLKTQTNLVIVTSNSAFDSNFKLENLRGDIFDALSTAEGFSTMSQYPKTKLLEIYAVRELASLLPLSQSGVIINCVSPGLCYTQLDQHAPLRIKILLAVMRKLLARTAEEGSRTLLQAAFAGPDSHGSYCSECQVKDRDIPAYITNETGQEIQKRVWSDLLTRLKSRGHAVDIAALATE